MTKCSFTVIPGLIFSAFQYSDFYKDSNKIGSREKMLMSAFTFISKTYKGKKSCNSVQCKKLSCLFYLILIMMAIKRPHKITIIKCNTYIKRFHKISILYLSQKYLVSDRQENNWYRPSLVSSAIVAVFNNVI